MEYPRDVNYPIGNFYRLDHSSKLMPAWVLKARVTPTYRRSAPNEEHNVKYFYRNLTLFRAGYLIIKLQIHARFKFAVSLHDFARD